MSPSIHTLFVRSKTLVVVTAAIALLLATPLLAAENTAAKPNFVFLFADDK